MQARGVGPIHHAGGILIPRVIAALFALGVIIACGDARGDPPHAAAHTASAPHPMTHADTMLDSAHAVTARLQQRCASDARMTSVLAAVRADSDSARADSVRRVTQDSITFATADSLGAADSAQAVAAHGAHAAHRHRPRRPHHAAAAVATQPASWHGEVARRALAQAPLPGSLFPGCRVVSYYGNPFSKRMGILGEINPDSMLARLQRQSDEYARADSATPVIPALELIVTVAQGSAGRDGMYRARMPDSVIDKVASWAERRGYLLILDIQVGRSSVRSEIAPLLKYLVRPTVHLALDPEFAMQGEKVPGHVIGTLDASQVNVAADTLAALVTQYQLPPKMLIVHRFTRPMLTNHERIHLDPRVQMVIDMDGFGAPILKRSSYRHYVFDHPVQFAGFKLFYKNDKPILTPAQVVKLTPSPVFIMYQ
ncbi:MAG: hypothetical protein ACREND_06835, partial [Gemmatimonadaceae bacterium]